ncbi:MAG: hypothetical protein M3N08_07335 [Pseudomonadota bacterium]|nr:hypothetical protein [Pseudomonadota bacterium]
MLGKLLRLATVGSSFASVGLLHRLLSGLATVVVLALATAFMVCVLLIGGFYLGYLGLVHYGLDPIVAGVAIGGVACLVTIGLILALVAQLKKMKSLSHPNSFIPHVALPTATGIVHAFFDGLLSPRKPAPPPPVSRRRA